MQPGTFSFIPLQYALEQWLFLMYKWRIKQFHFILTPSFQLKSHSLACWCYHCYSGHARFTNEGNSERLLSKKCADSSLKFCRWFTNSMKMCEHRNHQLQCKWAQIPDNEASKRLTLQCFPIKTVCSSAHSRQKDPSKRDAGMWVRLFN